MIEMDDGLEGLVAALSIPPFIIKDVIEENGEWYLDLDIPNWLDFEGYKGKLRDIAFTTPPDYSGLKNFIQKYSPLYECDERFLPLLQMGEAEIDYVFRRIRELSVDYVESMLRETGRQ